MVVGKSHLWTGAQFTFGYLFLYFGAVCIVGELRTPFSSVCSPLSVCSSRLMGTLRRRRSEPPRRDL